MKILSFPDQCKIATTKALCQHYKALRQEEQTVQTQLEAIRQELTQRGFFPSKEEIENLWRKYNASK